MFKTDIFDELTTINTFKRVDDMHPLNMYLGLDSMSRYTLLLVSDESPQPLKSSQIIDVSVGVRKDGKTATSFSLVNNEIEDIFIHFCNDIIESSRQIKYGVNEAEFVAERYVKWQNMLAKQNGDILSQSTIKGLIGELCFLKEYLIPKYGQEMAIHSWIGPDRADQDFVCGDTWYEVKSTVSGSDGVRISSVEQLDTVNSGHLVVVFLDKTSSADTSRLTLNALVEQINSSLETESLKERLYEILLNQGYYYRLEYDIINFKSAGMKLYTVGAAFPCIRRHDLHSTIGSVKYELKLSAIGAYEVEAQ